MVLGNHTAISHNCVSEVSLILSFSETSASMPWVLGKQSSSALKTNTTYSSMHFCDSALTDVLGPLKFNLFTVQRTTSSVAKLHTTLSALFNCSLKVLMTLSEPILIPSGICYRRCKTTVISRKKLSALFWQSSTWCINSALQHSSWILHWLGCTPLFVWSEALPMHMVCRWIHALPILPINIVLLQC